MFQIDPVTAVLVLERDGQLAEAIDESSPLRRFEAKEGEGVTVPVFWDSRQFESYVASHVDPSKKSQKRRSRGVPVEAPKLIFVARKGARFDGHSLIEQVLSSGNVFIGEYQHVDAYLKKQNLPKEWIHGVLTHPLFIKVRNSESSLFRLLEAASGLLPANFTTVAVTGTNGKTSVTQITGSLLTRLTKKDVLKLGTLGIELGDEVKEGNNPTMPDFPEFLEAVLEAKERSINHIVMEATSHGLHQGRLGNWLADVAIFTNLTQDHLDYHKTMAAYRSAKELLFERHVKHGGTVVINIEDPNWTHVVQKAAHPYRNCIGVGRGTKKKEFFSSTHNKFMSVRYLNISDRSTFRTGVQGVWTLENDKAALEQANFSSRLIGAFQHENLAFSAAALVGLGYPLTQIAQEVASIKSIPGRLELVSLAEPVEGPTILVDYAHSPDALEKTLNTCREIKGKAGKLVCVFGCGGDRDKTKRPLMGEISSKLADLSIVTSDNPRTEEPEAIINEILKGFTSSQKPTVEVDRKKAIVDAINGAAKEDLVLIAGKGHENYQIIGTKKIDFSDVEVARAALLGKIKRPPSTEDKNRECSTH